MCGNFSHLVFLNLRGLEITAWRQACFGACLQLGLRSHCVSSSSRDQHEREVVETSVRGRCPLASADDRRAVRACAHAGGCAVEQMGSPYDLFFACPVLEPLLQETCPFIVAHVVFDRVPVREYLHVVPYELKFHFQYTKSSCIVYRVF